MGKDRRLSREVLTNTVSSYGRDLVETIAFLVLIPFLIHALGQETYGLWALIWAFLGIFELLDIGLGPSVVKYIADCRGKEDPERERRIVCSLFWVYAGLGILLMVAISLSLFFFNTVFHIPEEKREAARLVLLILGLRGALSFPLGMFRGILIGYQKTRVANLYRTIGTVVHLGAVLLVIGKIPDIRYLAGLTLLQGVLPKLVMMIHVRRTAPHLTVHPRAFDRSVIRQVSGFAFSYLLIQVSGLVYARVGALITGYFLNLDVVAVYHVAARFAEKARQFCLPLIRNLAPVVAELHGAGDEESLLGTWYRGAKISTALSIPLMGGLAILGRPLIRTWIGEGSENFLVGAVVLDWLVAAYFIRIVHGNTQNMLTMGGHHWYVAWTTALSQLGNLILAIVLIHMMGIIGVAIATFLAVASINLLFLQGKAGRLHARSRLDFYRKTVLPSLVPGIIMAAVVLGLMQLWPITHLWEVAIMEGLAMAVFGVSFWFLGLKREERSYFFERVRNR